MAATSRKRSPSANWTFTLRGGCQSDSEESEEGDCNISNKAVIHDSTPNSDAQLLKDLDLSTREDTANFVSNPWSIAKVNAASCPSYNKTIGNSVASSSSKSQTLPKGPLYAGFQKQIAKYTDGQTKNSNSEPKIKGRRPKPAIHPTPRKVEDVDASMTATAAGPVAMNKRVEGLSASKGSPKHHLPPMSDQTQFNRICHSTGRLPTNGGNKVPICASFSSPAYKSSASIRSSFNPPQQIHNLLSPFNSTPKDRESRTSSPLMTPFQVQTSNHTYHENENIDNLSQTEFLSNQDAQEIYNHNQSMLVTPLAVNNVSHRLSTNAPTMLGEVGAPNVFQESVKCSSIDGFPQWLASSLPPRHITPVSVPGHSYDEQNPLASEVNQVSPFTGRKLHSRRVYDAENQSSVPSPLPNRHRALSPSPSPPPAPRKLPELSCFRYQNTDAYESLEPNEDEAWSTLPSRKKIRKEPRSENLKQSGRFRLPLAGLGKNTTAGNKSNRRVVTYLPPPQRNADTNIVKKPVTSWTVKRIQQDALTKNTNDVLSKRPDAKIIYSPKRTVTRNEQSSEPDSDVTLVPSSSPLNKSDHTLSVSLDDISQAYAGVRRSIAESKKMQRCLWDILGLQSCGVVCRDDDAKDEMSIVVWNGQNVL